MVCNVYDFGAAGDGARNDTAAVRRALEACRDAGGGTALLPPGVYRCGTLRIYGNTELRLEAGAVLLASPDYADYPEIVSGAWDTSYAPRKNSRCLLYAECAERVSITGAGVIECHGLDFCEPNPAPDAINLLRRRTNEVIPRVVLFVRCAHFELRGFTLRDSPAGWAVWLLACRDGVVSGVHIESDYEMPNADGLHINCCQRIAVSDCVFRTGDDALIVRAYSAMLPEPTPCEAITVTNCLLSSHSNAVRVGWCGDGVIRDCVFSNLVIENSVCGLTVQIPKFEARVADEGVERPAIERLLFTNITMRDVFFEPIHIGVMEGARVEYIRALRFSGITSVSRRPPRFNGSTDARPSDIELDGCRFDVRPTLEYMGHMPAQYYLGDVFGRLPAVSNVDRLRMRDVEITL